MRSPEIEFFFSPTLFLTENWLLIHISELKYQFLWVVLIHLTHFFSVSVSLEKYGSDFSLNLFVQSLSELLFSIQSALLCLNTDTFTGSYTLNVTSFKV